MEQKSKSEPIVYHHHSIWPITVIIVCRDLPDEHMVIKSKEEMNQLLDEVKLFNSENKDNPKRVIST